MIVTLPTPAEVLAGITTWSSPFFTDLLPLVYVSVGFFAVSAIILFIIGTVHAAVSRYFLKQADN